MDTLEKLKKQFPFEVSDAAAPAPDPVKTRSGLVEYEKKVKRPPESWKQSKAIIELSEYLKTCDGIRLMEHNGRPVMHFVNGITPKNKTRWTQAEQALDLLEVALDDIEYLLKKNDSNCRRVETFDSTVSQ